LEKDVAWGSIVYGPIADADHTFFAPVAKSGTIKIIAPQKAG
jgi:hypothetical protein